MVKRILLPLFLILWFLLPFHQAEASRYDKPHELVDKAYITLKKFLQDDQMTWLREHLREAYGIIIVPQMLKGAFFIGGAGGSGVLLARLNDCEWSYPAFYLLGSVSFGLQIGGEASELVLLVMNRSGIDALLSTAVKLGGDLSVAAGPVGIGAKAQIADVLAFGYSKGAFIGVSVEGAVIKPRDSWNRIYYGRPVRPVDIIYGRKVSNPHADKLRNLLRDYCLKYRR
ncbi:MAG: lipid-binding SYLF domain-containing protein [Thermodesulfobacteria bacterium]|nr:lipid-binding SYLF domain-containing protein [Thermodesulfobacteriota bacterium]